MSKNKNEELLPYYEKAKELLDYNPDTGVFTWKVNKGVAKKGFSAGYRDTKGYIQIKINGKSLRGHRLAWFFIYKKLPNIIDHIDENPSNNIIRNLRSCTNAENQRNRGVPSNNKSGYKGVCWYKCKNKWISRISHNGKLIYLGLFNCPKEASEAYENKAKELYGEFYNGRI